MQGSKWLPNSSLWTTSITDLYIMVEHAVYSCCSLPWNSWIESWKALLHSQNTSQPTVQSKLLCQEQKQMTCPLQQGNTREEFMTFRISFLYMDSSLFGANRSCSLLWAKTNGSVRFMYILMIPKENLVIT